eukprot:993160-Lingulodinium_polyedra.AAC.1
MLDRFVAQRLDTQEARGFHFLFAAGISCNVAEWRWMSLIHGVEAVVRRQFPLRVYFSQRKMDSQQEPQDDHQEAQGMAREHPAAEVSCSELEAVLQDASFWAYSHMLLIVQGVLKDLE